MQLVFFDDYRLGVLANERVVDISDLVGGATPQARLEALPLRKSR